MQFWWRARIQGRRGFRHARPCTSSHNLCRKASRRLAFGYRCRVNDFVSISKRTAVSRHNRLSSLPLRCVDDLREVLARLPEAALLVVDGRISFANARALSLFGRPSPSLTGRLMLELFHPTGAGRRQSRQARQGRLLSRERCEALGTLLCAGGLLRTVKMSSAPVRNGGRRLQLVLLHDLTEHTRDRSHLTQAHAHLAQLTAALDAAQQEERRRMSDRLHDEAQQTLAAIRFNLDVVARSVEETLPETAALVARTSSMAHAALVSTRGLIEELGPPILDELGLVAALEALTAHFGRGRTVRARFAVSGFDTPEEPVASAIAQCLYRVAQEALDNTARHAQASLVEVLLTRTPEGGLLLRVADDGVGMGDEDRDDPATVGLAVLRTRLQALGGNLQVHSTRGSGTVLLARVPAEPAVAAAVASATSPSEEPFNALLQFFYRVPVGLVQLRLDGSIEMLNPLAARWLMSLSPNGHLDNVFSVLSAVAPDLADQAAAVSEPSGVVCEALPLGPVGGAGAGDGCMLTLKLVRQDGERLMAVLNDFAAA